MNQPITGPDALAVGQDWTGRWRILAPERVRVSANANIGATSIEVDPLQDALLDGDFLIFDQNTVIEVTAAAPAGAISLAVTSPGNASLLVPLRSGQKGQKIRDLTDADPDFEVLAEGDDETPILDSADVSFNLATQTAFERGIIDVTIPAVATATLVPGQYFYSLWNRASGATRPWASGAFEIVGLGFV